MAGGSGRWGYRAVRPRSAPNRAGEDGGQGSEWPLASLALHPLLLRDDRMRTRDSAL